MNTPRDPSASGRRPGAYGAAERPCDTRTLVRLLHLAGAKDAPSRQREAALERVARIAQGHHGPSLRDWWNWVADHHRTQCLILARRTRLVPTSALGAAERDERIDWRAESFGAALSELLERHGPLVPLPEDVFSAVRDRSPRGFAAGLRHALGSAGPVEPSLAGELAARLFGKSPGLDVRIGDATVKVRGYSPQSLRTALNRWARDAGDARRLYADPRGRAWLLDPPQTIAIRAHSPFALLRDDPDRPGEPDEDVLRDARRLASAGVCEAIAPERLAGAVRDRPDSSDSEEPTWYSAVLDQSGAGVELGAEADLDSLPWDRAADWLPDAASRLAVATPCPLPIGGVDAQAVDGEIRLTFALPGGTVRSCVRRDSPLDTLADAIRACAAQIDTELRARGTATRLACAWHASDDGLATRARLLPVPAETFDWLAPALDAGRPTPTNQP